MGATTCALRGGLSAVRGAREEHSLILPRSLSPSPSLFLSAAVSIVLLLLPLLLLLLLLLLIDTRRKTEDYKQVA